MIRECLGPEFNLAKAGPGKYTLNQITTFIMLHIEDVYLENISKKKG